VINRKIFCKSGPGCQIVGSVTTDWLTTYCMVACSRSVVSSAVADSHEQSHAASVCRSKCRRQCCLLWWRRHTSVVAVDSRRQRVWRHLQHSLRFVVCFLTVILLLAALWSGPASEMDFICSECSCKVALCPTLYYMYLQCFDAVGWAAGRASGLYKTEWWGAGVVICLERGADLHVAQLMPVPLTVTCFS